ncbi:uncharacterized protein LOC117179748 isoform X1 [Belonocnema kinseyi]|uniref:uncharacterized protein LOC117179748 isoform X1 n=1 Tax=Belonocnema kinseyi TaxID=2817044 RepID=UPI00143CEF05|nr:uncharacterized protein LOC117179748 isoform X1 [Belonocnema kinseyi]
MDFLAVNVSEPSTSFVFQKEVAEVEEIPVYDIESEDEGIEIEYIKINSSPSKFIFDNTFVEVSEIPQKWKDKRSHLSQTDPLAESGLEKRQDVEETVEILNDSSSQRKVGKGWTQLSSCTNACYLTITEDEQKKLFHSYWYERTFHSRFDYVNEMIEMIEEPLGGDNSKLCTKYFLKTSKGRQSLCRRCFCHILDVSPSFMKTVLDKKLLEMKQMPPASENAILESENTRMELSDVESKDDVADVEMPEPIEVSGDELPKETLSVSNDDSLLFETIRQNSKIKPELRIKGPSCNFLRDMKIGQGWKRLRPCPSACNLRLTDEDQKNLFDCYWKEATFQSRFKFLNEMLIIIPVENRDTENARTARIKRYNTNYYLTTSQGSTKVCRSCFKIALNESDYLIDSVLEKKWCVMKTIKKLRDDGVQVRDVDPNEEEMKKVKEHIKKFPLCESNHFTDHSFENYLPMGLSLKTMYELYQREVSNPVPINWYQTVLVQTELKFKPIFLGKCEQCEITSQKFRTSTDPEEKSRLNCLLTSHLVDAREGQDSKTLDENLAKHSKNTLLVCSFAFQMTLPTPFLKEPTAYYRQPLWTYNLTIQQQGIGKSTRRIPKFYMWHEGDGKKTANEIASCLYQYLLELPRCVKSVIFYSTSDNRDNRSKSISKMFLHFLENHKTLKTVDHKFLIRGHFQIQNNLQNGWDQAIIKEHRGKIQEPKNWYDAFSKPFKPNNEPKVIVMTREKFYDYERLYKDQDDSFIDEKVKWVRYTEGFVRYKNSWAEKDRFQVLNCLSQSQLCELDKTNLSNLENFYITEEKKKGLLELLLFMSPKVKSFYEGLPVQVSVCPNLGLAEETVLLKRKLEQVEETAPTQEDVISNEGEKHPKQKKIPDEIDSTEFEIVSILKQAKPVKVEYEFSKSNSKTEAVCKLPAGLPFCNKECCLSITEDDQKRIFNNYWHHGTFESRIDFVCNLIKISRNKPEKAKRKRFSAKFHLDTEGGRKVVCKPCFRHVLDISDSFIGIVLEKKWEQINNEKEPSKSLVDSQIPEIKLRKNTEEAKSNHPTVEKIRELEDHIKKFPLCANQHFIHPASEKYLPIGLTLTIQIMYDIYRNEVLNPLGIGKYQEILYKTDLKFQPRFLGKCERCERSSEMMPFMVPKIKNVYEGFSVDESLLSKAANSNGIADQENSHVNSIPPVQTCILKEELIIESDDLQVRDECKKLFRKTC